jgi:hypothetical protein
MRGEDSPLVPETMAIFAMISRRNRLQSRFSDLQRSCQNYSRVCARGLRPETAHGRTYPRAR